MKNLWAIALALFVAAPLSAALVLVEAYNEAPFTILDKGDTVIAVELSFSVDTTCYVQLSTGGIGSRIEVRLDADGERLPVRTSVDIVYQGKAPLTMIYSYLVNPGEHTVYFKMTRAEADFATCSNAYLQALIFLPNEPSAVAEPPGEPGGVSPLPVSIISKGPYVNIAGATELVDASGRVIKNAIEADKVFIATLPTGTYFARSEERTIVKIVKVE